MHLPRDFQKHPVQKGSAYPYAGIMNFSEGKFNEFPRWLVERDRFTDFMYEHYENRLLTIPHICEKEQRGPDELQLISRYLSQIPVFHVLPYALMDVLTRRIEVRYFASRALVFAEDEEPEYLGIVYVGKVEEAGMEMGPQSLIGRGAFYNRVSRRVVALEQTIVLAVGRTAYTEIQALLQAEVRTRERDEISEMVRSTFFQELRCSERRAKELVALMSLEFYLAGECICQAGEAPRDFWILVRGVVLEENHIFIREFNKWPADRRKWEVRAVYVPHRTTRSLDPFSFFADEEILREIKLRSDFVASTHCILMRMPASTFLAMLTTDEAKRLRKFHSEHSVLNYA